MTRIEVQHLPECSPCPSAAAASWRRVWVKEDRSSTLVKRPRVAIFVSERLLLPAFLANHRSTLSSISPSRGSCREGWASFQGSCYWLSSTTATWKKAEETCRSHGAHLLVFINNLSPSNAFQDFISQIVVVIFHYWIGLVEPHQEGEWTWVDGTDFSSTPTENGEDCGQLHASVKRIRKLWNDADCNLSYRFICESKA
uniref:Asialoglycoprotein receptor-like 1 n=1 Tax=Oryzias melastigma TaxID=30732 RepID=A0A3B3CDI1_ORYME